MPRSLRPASRPLLQRQLHLNLPLGGLAGLAFAGLLTACAAAAAPAPPPADNAHLGAVFFTPAQRQAITQARRPAASSATATTASSAAAAPEALRFDGLVRSSQGMASAFVNGREVRATPYGAAAAHTPRAAMAAPHLDGHAVRLAEGTRLVVGQTALPGATPADLVPAGSVGRTLASGANTPPAVPADALQLRRSSGLPEAAAHRSSR